MLERLQLALHTKLDKGQDDALLRFAVGSAAAKAQLWVEARTHLSRAVHLNPAHSASWQTLGEACNALGDTPAAINAYQQGIQHAQANGDLQAVKVMTVFLRRLSPPPTASTT